MTPADLAPMAMAPSHVPRGEPTPPVAAVSMPAVGETRTYQGETRSWDGHAWRLASGSASPAARGPVETNPNGSTRTFLGTEDFGGRMKRYAGAVLPEMARTVAQPVLHPIDTIEGVAHAARHPLDTASGMLKQGEDALAGDPKAAGQILGMIATPKVYGTALRATNATSNALATNPAFRSTFGYVGGYLTGKAMGEPGFAGAILGRAASPALAVPATEVAKGSGWMLDKLGMRSTTPTPLVDEPLWKQQAEMESTPTPAHPNPNGATRTGAPPPRTAAAEAPTAAGPTGARLTPEELAALKNGTLKVGANRGGGAGSVPPSTPPTPRGPVASAASNARDVAGRDLGATGKGPAPRPAGPWDTNAGPAGVRDAATNDALMEGLTGQTPNAAGQTPRPSAPGTTASVPFMVTRAMEADLRTLGLSQAQIDALTPAQAHEALRAGRVAPPAAATPEPQWPGIETPETPETPGAPAPHVDAPPSQPRILSWKEGAGPSTGDASTLRGKFGSKTAASILKTTPETVKGLAPEMNPRALPSELRAAIDRKLPTLSPEEATAYLKAAPNALVRAYIARKLGLE